MLNQRPERMIQQKIKQFEQWNQDRLLGEKLYKSNGNEGQLAVIKFTDKKENETRRTRELLPTVTENLIQMENIKNAENDVTELKREVEKLKEDNRKRIIEIFDLRAANQLKNDENVMLKKERQERQEQLSINCTPRKCERCAQWRHEVNEANKRSQTALENLHDAEENVKSLEQELSNVDEMIVTNRSLMLSIQNMINVNLFSLTTERDQLKERLGRSEQKMAEMEAVIIELDGQCTQLMILKKNGDVMLERAENIIRELTEESDSTVSELYAVPKKKSFINLGKKTLTNVVVDNDKRSTEEDLSERESMVDEREPSYASLTRQNSTRDSSVRVEDAQKASVQSDMSRMEKKWDVLFKDGQESNIRLHRWETKAGFGIRQIRCPICLKGLPRVKSTKRCVDCDLCVHKKCVDRVKETCGFLQ